MVSQLCNAAGPMAALILDSQMDRMGETRQAFPKERLNELLGKVCKEISSDELRLDFLRSMQREVKALAV